MNYFVNEHIWLLKQRAKGESELGEKKRRQPRHWWRSMLLYIPYNTGTFSKTLEACVRKITRLRLDVGRSFSANATIRS